MKKSFMNQLKRMRKSDDMNYLDFNGEQYLSIKDIYMNLCVSRNSIIKKIERLEKEGYVLRIKNRRPELYISKKGYEKLKNERINYLNEKIIEDPRFKEYYSKLIDAIEKPKMWSEFHNKEIRLYI